MAIRVDRRAVMRRRTDDPITDHARLVAGLAALGLMAAACSSGRRARRRRRRPPPRVVGNDPPGCGHDGRRPGRPRRRHRVRRAPRCPGRRRPVPGWGPAMDRQATLTVGIGSDIGGLDPQSVPGTGGGNLPAYGPMFGGDGSGGLLAIVDPATKEWLPGVAQSWEVTSSDLLTWTFKLPRRRQVPRRDAAHVGGRQVQHRPDDRPGHVQPGLRERLALAVRADRRVGRRTHPIRCPWSST